MDSTWVLEQLTAPPTRAALWLTLSFLLAGTSTFLTRLVAPELERFVRIVRWVQVPYFGLILGGLSPRLMGLTLLGWDSRYTLGLIVLVCLLVLLVLIRIRLHTEPDQIDGISLTGQTLSPSLIESCAQEFHWCFLRGAVWNFCTSVCLLRFLPNIGLFGSPPRFHCQESMYSLRLFRSAY